MAIPVPDTQTSPYLPPVGGVIPNPPPAQPPTQMAANQPPAPSLPQVAPRALPPMWQPTQTAAPAQPPTTPPPQQPPATSFSQGQQQAQTSGQPVEVRVPGGAGSFWVDPNGNVTGARPTTTAPAFTPQPAPPLDPNVVKVSTHPATPSDDPYGAGGLDWTVPQANAQGRSQLSPQQMQALPALIKETAKMWDIPPEILGGVFGAETDFGRNITTSSAGAKGPLQFIDETASRYGVNVNDVRSSMEGAAHYLHDLYQQYGNWPHALQAYNGALNDPSMKYANTVLKYSGQSVPTQQYVPVSQMGPAYAERPANQWGREPQGGYGPLPTPQQYPSLLQGLMPIIGLLSGRSGIAAVGVMNMYSGYIKGRQQGQLFATKLAQEQFSLQVAQHDEQMKEENQAIGEAMAIDPDGTKGPLMDVANKYGDSVLAQAISMGHGTVEKLMQARDRYNTDLSKLNLSLEKQRQEVQDQQDFNNAVNADLQAWVDDFTQKNQHPPNKNEIAQARQSIKARRQEEAKTTKGTTGDKVTKESLMANWLEQQRNDPARWSGGAVGKGDYREPTIDEQAKELGRLTTESTKTPVSAHNMAVRIEIAAGDLAPTLEAMTKLGSDATLGAFGGAQAMMTGDPLDNLKRTLANRAVSGEDQIMTSLSRGIGRSLATLMAGGAAQGLVGLADKLQADVPENYDTGYNRLMKFADMRNILDAAVNVLKNDETISLNDKQRQMLDDLQTRVAKAIPYTQSDVLLASRRPNSEDFTDLAKKLGVIPGGPGQTTTAPTFGTPTPVQ